MERTFYKYQGTGNDFILLDDREETFPIDNQPLIENLCKRYFGIGADGLMLLRNKEGYDFEMVYFNSDGRLSSMCGNGGRCISKFAFDLGLVGNEMRFIAVDGPHEALILENASVKLKMKDVNHIYQGKQHFELDTGSPHYVRFTQYVDVMDFVPEAAAIRFQERYQKRGGININFCEIIEGEIFVRTYERGVENETLSCGTGVVASALSAALQGYQSPVTIKARGGDLKVYFTKKAETEFSDIWLEGPAEFVFKGTIEV